MSLTDQALSAVDANEYFFGEEEENCCLSPHHPSYLSEK